MGREEPSGVDGTAMIPMSGAAYACVSYRVACAATLMVVFVREYVCLSVILFLRVHMGACMVTFCLFFSVCVCVCVCLMYG